VDQEINCILPENGTDPGTRWRKEEESGDAEDGDSTEDGNRASVEAV
jgi:hypothetical protein